jgi:hypothetical protein
MAPRQRDNGTLDLLSWQPPEPVRAFPAEKVRAASLRAAVAKAVSLALKECEQDREEIAVAIGEYLGEPCSKAMLDAYASEAREEHVINVVRFIALMHATGDRRLLQMLAEPFGLAVIDARYLPAIEDALLDDKIAELTQRRQFARRKWKGV